MLEPRLNKLGVPTEVAEGQDAPDLDIDGNEIRLKADGFLARVLQHEIDHTNGTVFIDHIRDITNAFYTLDDSGELQPLDYDEHIKANPILWD